MKLTDEQIERIYHRYGGDMINCARAIERQVEAALTEKQEPHTDHPMRHYDRTCPACNPAPVNQQPLTEEQVIIALESRGRRGYGPYEEGFFDGVEFAEKHHGIAAAAEVKV